MNRFLNKTLCVLALLFFVGCASLTAPPTSLRANQSTNNFDCKPSQTATVLGATNCATQLQHAYMERAIQLRSGQTETDVSLIGASAGAAGVASFDGSTNIIRGLSVLGATVLGFDTYAKRKDASDAMFKASGQLACLTRNSQYLLATGQEHGKAMEQMTKAKEALEESKADTKVKSRFDDAYEYCEYSPATQAIGGYSDSNANADEKNNALNRKLAALVMTGVQLVDEKTIQAFYQGRDRETDIAALAKELQKRAEASATMQAKADGVAEAVDEAPKPAAANADDETTKANETAKAEAETAAKGAATTTKKLLDILTDLDACLLAP